jgi:hypothetical protein
MRIVLLFDSDFSSLLARISPLYCVNIVAYTVEVMRITTNA